MVSGRAGRAERSGRFERSRRSGKSYDVPDEELLDCPQVSLEATEEEEGGKERKRAAGSTVLSTLLEAKESMAECRSCGDERFGKSSDVLNG